MDKQYTDHCNCISTIVICISVWSHICHLVWQLSLPRLFIFVLTAFCLFLYIKNPPGIEVVFSILMLILIPEIIHIVYIILNTAQLVHNVASRPASRRQLHLGYITPSCVILLTAYCNVLSAACRLI